MRYYADIQSCFSIDIIDDLVWEMFEIDGKDKLELVLRQCLTQAELQDRSPLREYIVETMDL